MSEMAAVEDPGRLRRLAQAVANTLAERMPKLFGHFEHGDERNTVELYTKTHSAQAGEQVDGRLNWNEHENEDAHKVYGRMSSKLDHHGETTACEIDIGVRPEQDEKLVNATVKHEIMHCGMRQILGAEGRENFLGHVATHIPVETIGYEWYGEKIHNLTETEKDKYTKNADGSDRDATIAQYIVGEQTTAWYSAQLGVGHWASRFTDEDDEKIDVNRAGEDGYWRAEQWIEESYAFRNEHREHNGQVAELPNAAPSDERSMQAWADAMGQDMSAVYAGTLDIETFRARYAPVLDKAPAGMEEARSRNEVLQATHASDLDGETRPGPQRGLDTGKEAGAGHRHEHESTDHNHGHERRPAHSAPGAPTPTEQMSERLREIQAERSSLEAKLVKTGRSNGQGAGDKRNTTGHGHGHGRNALEREASGDGHNQPGRHHSRHDTGHGMRAHNQALRRGTGVLKPESVQHETPEKDRAQDRGGMER